MAYRSPLPTIMARDYVNRDKAGNATMATRHLFPKPGGGEILCNPPLCREHWREANW